jgi:sugar phosphate isomerase/epimerase
VKLAVSNIAWPAEADERVAELLVRKGVRAVEVAPGKIRPNAADITPGDAADYRRSWELRGVRIVAMQALLFGRLDLTVFGEAAVRGRTLAHLTHLIAVAEMLGARVLVFGSPKNRLVGTMPADEARAIAVEFFGRLGEEAARRGGVFCIEPNPAPYGGDFVTTVAEAVELVRAVNHPGFAVHLDAGGMALGNDLDPATIARSRPRHFHVSEPHLQPVPATAPHAFLAGQLHGMGYDGYCSIEMRQADGDWLGRLETAVDFAAATYGLPLAAERVGRSAASG